MGCKGSTEKKTTKVTIYPNYAKAGEGDRNGFAEGEKVSVRVTFPEGEESPLVSFENPKHDAEDYGVASWTEEESTVSIEIDAEEHKGKFVRYDVLNTDGNVLGSYRVPVEKYLENDNFHTGWQVYFWRKYSKKEGGEDEAEVEEKGPDGSELHIRTEVEGQVPANWLVSQYTLSGCNNTDSELDARVDEAGDDLVEKLKEKHPKGIRVLIVSGAAVTVDHIKGIVEAFPDIEEIKVLTAPEISAAVTKDGLAEFAKLSKLAYLSFDAAPGLTDESVSGLEEAISRIKAFQVTGSKTEVSDDSVALFAKAEQIRFVGLRATKITLDGTIKVLEGAKALESITPPLGDDGADVVKTSDDLLRVFAAAPPQFGEIDFEKAPDEAISADGVKEKVPHRARMSGAFQHLFKEYREAH